MGIFDDYLICSDYDNTLTYNGTLPVENLSAIRHFRDEGGKFVVATGRTAQSAISFDKELIEDGYVITNNGNVLFDINKNMPIKAITIKLNCFDILKQVLEIENGCIKKYGIYFPDESIYFKSGTPEFKENECVIKDGITKMAFECDTEEHALSVMKRLSDFYGNSLICTRAWPCCFEICDAEGGKGAMLQELKKLFSIKKLICVGDYENDVAMLAMADISIAPSNCAGTVRTVADRIIEASDKGIFSEIIGFLQSSNSIRRK